MKIFSFVKKKDIDRITECGLSAEEYGVLNAFIGGSERLCILGYITPYDSCLMSDEEYIPLKVNPKNSDVIVAEGMYRQSGLAEHFKKSFVKLSEYKFGSYRKPECLIPGTVLPDEIERYNPKMDEPLLYTYSEELYIDSAFVKAEDDKQSFRELSLKAMYDREVRNGKITCFTEGGHVFYTENEKIVFISEDDK